jgi:predicted TIM-barrel fold metal-dependent hydrolase
MIIDANTHVTESGQWFHTAHDASIARLRGEIEQAGIDLALVVPLPNTIDPDRQHTLLKGEEKMYSAETFIPASFTSVAEAVSAFQQRFSHRPATFVKFHNRFGQYHPEDERFLAVIDANDQLENPHVVGVCGLLHDRHTAYAVDPVIYFFNLAQRMHRSKLIIMHGSGTHILRLAEACRYLHHVFIDLSMTLTKYKNTSIAQDIRWICQHYDRRVIWASDFPESPIVQSLLDFEDVVGELSEEKRANILGLNIAKLLNIQIKGA